MTARRDDTGCLVYEAQAALEPGNPDEEFRWLVAADCVDGVSRSLIVTGKSEGSAFVRTVRPGRVSDPQVYDLTLARRLGANLVSLSDGQQRVRFSVYAPNAQRVELVMADPEGAYIADDGTGGGGPTVMSKEGAGVWSADVDADAVAGAMAYMFRVTKDDGTVAYRTDLFSRAQIGSGSFDPKGQPCAGEASQIDGTKSCSLVCDPRHVRDTDGRLVSAGAFWADEWSAGKPLPERTQDLVIYELHVGALAFGRAKAGTLDDAIAFIDHLVRLGVNAVELLPLAEFQSDTGWGYSTSHFAAIEQSAGGVDRLKHFVRACHREGIAVILDVVYNHYSGDAERAEWMYDTNDHRRNFCYWYQGNPETWFTKEGKPIAEGGYVDNMSTGYAPRYNCEIVRQLFISSAAQFVTDVHIDGFRVDQTTSIHAYPVFHANGTRADDAAVAGIEFLRQWTQTLRLIKPGIFLMAEDHSGWDRVTMAYEGGGLGFDAAWYSDFYHHLVDFGEGGSDSAKLLRNAGYGDGRRLNMTTFAHALAGSADRKVVYNDSHDEAGNSKGSARTICLAVNFAPLVGETRGWAEARIKVAAGLAMLSAGTPMFFMGEEVGAREPYRYDDFRLHREDLIGLRRGLGARVFAFYVDLVALSRGNAAIRSRNIEILAVHDDNRIVCFRRWSGGDEREFVVVASFNDRAFDNPGYRVSHASLAGKRWREVLNSDLDGYGGKNASNAAAALDGNDFEPIVPAVGIVAFGRVS